MSARALPCMLLPALLLVAGSPAQATDLTLEISEDLLNEVVSPFRWSSLSGSGEDLPACPGAPSGVITACHHVGWFHCPPVVPGADLAGAPGASRIPILVCEEVGGDPIFLPGEEPVEWRYSVNDWRFSVTNAGIRFHVTLNVEVDGEFSQITREVDSRIVFDAQSGALRLVVEPLKIPLVKDTCIVSEVDVAARFSFSVPLGRRTLSVPDSSGGSTNVEARISSVTPSYQSGGLRLAMEVDYQ